MKIALINPPQIFTKFQIGAYLVPPLGIAYLASYVLSKGIDVQVIDSLEQHRTVTKFRENIYLRGMTFEKIVDRIDDDIQLIGISNLFSYASPAVEELSQELKKRYPHIPIVLGGPHPGALPELSMRRANAEYVIIGEGEMALTDLCFHLDGKLQLEEVQGLAYLSEDKSSLIKNKPSKRMKNLDAENSPWPARHLLPYETYIAEMEGHGSTNLRWTTMLSSRGCPYSCTFCQSRQTKWLSRTAIDVVDEMEYCVKEFGIKEFHFEDDNMTISKKRTIEICDEILKRKLDIVWQTPNGIRASVMDDDLLIKMKESGCSHITLAPESGSLRVLNDIIAKGRDFKLSHLEELGTRAHKLGLRVAAYFIIGLPGEKPEDVKQTIAFSNKLARAGVDEAGFTHFIPLPGTPLWDKSIDDDSKVDFLDLLVASDLSRTISWAEDLSPDQIEYYIKKAYRSFLMNRALFHPLLMMRSLINVARGIAETKTENYLRMFLKQIKRKKLEEQGVSEINVMMRTEAVYAYNDTILKTFYMIMKDIVPSLLFKKKKS